VQSDIITIDGPGGAGKSTLAKRLAQNLGWAFLDTGAIYRTVALCLIESQHTQITDSQLGQLAQKLELKFILQGHEQKLYLKDRDVGESIRTAEVTKLASKISGVKELREALLTVQRRLGAVGRLVTEGRDMGTVVFPEAKLKFYLEADLAVRAKRRYDELINKGAKADYSEVLTQLSARDKFDETRQTAPLRKAPKAIVIDSTGLGLDEVFEIMFKKAREIFPN
jgi:cytidylate kinase